MLYEIVSSILSVFIEHCSTCRVVRFPRAGGCWTQRSLYYRLCKESSTSTDNHPWWFSESVGQRSGNTKFGFIHSFLALAFVPMPSFEFEFAIRAHNRVQVRIPNFRIEKEIRILIKMPGQIDKLSNPIKRRQFIFLFIAHWASDRRGFSASCDCRGKHRRKCRSSRLGEPLPQGVYF